MKRTFAFLMTLMASSVQAFEINPWLAQSPWPASHGSSSASGSSEVAGPTSTNQLGKPSFVATGLINITLATSPRYRNGEFAHWGSSFTNVYKLRTVNGSLQKVSTLNKPYNKIKNIFTPTSGAYTLVDINNVLFTVQGTHLLAYGDSQLNNINSPITLLRDYDITRSNDVSSDDAIVGLNMTWDGNITFATKKGVVGVIDRNFTTLKTIKLDTGTKVGKVETVSNSISTDSKGGIYVVSDLQMYRVQWTGSQLTMDESLGAWKSDYILGAGSSISLGAGSGSTPSVMGEGDQQFIVITDGADVANIVLFWKDAIPTGWAGINGNRRMAAQMPVNFGDSNRSRTSSEQSVLVNGYGAVVVSNDLKNQNLLPPNTGNDAIDRSLDNAVGTYFSGTRLYRPQGVQKFEWDKTTRKLSSKWVRTDISCPNSIPTSSIPSNVFYCVGSSKGTGIIGSQLYFWTIEGLNFTTGASVLRKYIDQAALPNFNSFYASTSIAPDGGIIYGSLTGAVYIPRVK
jgi:hypothetical protein